VKLLIKDLGNIVCLVEARRIRVSLARESLHQVLLFLWFCVVPSVIPSL